MTQARIENSRKALDALQRAGAAGVPTEKLAEIAGLRFGARVWELRQEGWDITTHLRKGTELARYVLHGRRNPGQLSIFEVMERA